MQHILGIRPDFGGLVIAASIPRKWEGFTATRVFRGATYTIEVRNPHHVCKGVKTLVVDGETVEGNVVFWMGSGQHRVVATLGV